MEGDEMEAVLEEINENDLNTMRLFRQLTYTTAKPNFKEEYKDITMNQFWPLPGDSEAEPASPEELKRDEAIGNKLAEILSKK